MAMLEQLQDSRGGTFLHTKQSCMVYPRHESGVESSNHKSYQSPLQQHLLVLHPEGLDPPCSKPTG